MKILNRLLSVNRKIPFNPARFPIVLYKIHLSFVIQTFKNGGWDKGKGKRDNACVHIHVCT